MAEVKITDLVPQETIDKIIELDQKIQVLLDTYTNTAKELAKGLDINVKVTGDLDKLEKLVIDKEKEAAQTVRQLNEAYTERSKVLNATTPVLAKDLMQKERLNKAHRQEYTELEKVKQILADYYGDIEEQGKLVAKLSAQISANTAKQKENEKAYKNGLITLNELTERNGALTVAHAKLTQEKRGLQQVMAAEVKMMQTENGSYKEKSQALELLKKAYKDLSDIQKDRSFGKEMEEAIQNLDIHLKESAADMGEFQRNVGNYAIAGQNGVVTTDSVTAALQQEALTMQDLIDQTRILEEAKVRLNTNDANYEQTLAAVNAKIDENKAKLTDVSDILNKDATSAAEAEAQNKRLQEAMKHVDISADGAQKKIDELNAKITKNNEVIERATPTTEKLAKAEKELAKEAEKAAKEAEKAANANKKSADQLLSIIGINNKFGSSLRNLEGSGNVFSGLQTKVAAFGKTLMGLLANPYALALLGIAGVAAGFKWWYDYNKGLIEASRLTATLTGATGEMADKITADMSGIADTLGSDYKDTMKAANTLVQQYGISWNEAMELMKDGYQAGANASGNMVENIQQFGPAMRDLGVSAEEFVAILSNTKSGIFDEKGVQDILNGGKRLRAMTKNMAADLDAVGISSQKMQEDLAQGNITMMDAVQQIAGKLKELPENSQEAGRIMKDVFGRTAADGGTLLIQSIADVNTNLEECIENSGELGRLNREQMEAQQELQETLAAVFKMSGTSFQELTTAAKTYVIQGLTKIIKGCVDIVNWFIRLYNNSTLVRGAINAIGHSFKVLWTVAKTVVSQLIDSFKAFGNILEDILTGNWDRIAEHYRQGATALQKNITGMIQEIEESRKKAIKNTLEGDYVAEISYELTGDDVSNGVGGRVRTDPDYKSKPDPNAAEKAAKEREKAAAKAKKEAEKRAKEELKIIQALEDSKIALMKDGHEKDLLLIRQKFKKKLDAIKGNSEQEEELRLSLAAECEKEVAECELNYHRELAKTNLANAIAVAKEGSREMLDLKLAQLEQQRIKEVEEAEKKGGDINLIEAKYYQKRIDMQEEFAEQYAELVEKEYAMRADKLNNAMLEETLELKRQYAEQLQAAGDNMGKREVLEAEFTRRMEQITYDYAVKTAQDQIEMFEKILQTEELSAEKRYEIEQRLNEAKLALQETYVDRSIKLTEHQDTATQKWLKKNEQMIDSFAQAAADMLNGVTELVSAIYDGQIQKIEEEQEAAQASADKEIERIESLVEREIISVEEGEARKRAAEALSAKKQEELEKKKQALKIKQAKWDKANSIAQATISTALAVLNALKTQPFWLGIAMAAVAGAMGAAQIATIAAQPIPAYKDGTPYHHGGPALVGDGGRREVVLYRGSAWLTPDTPTLMDIPKGAEVLPSMDKYLATLPELLPEPKVEMKSPKAYDDKRMLREVSELKNLIRQHTRQQHRDAYLAQYEIFKKGI